VTNIQFRKRSDCQFCSSVKVPHTTTVQIQKTEREELGNLETQQVSHSLIQEFTRKNTELKWFIQVSKHERGAVNLFFCFVVQAT
jgi:hypothetical protein